MGIIQDLQAEIINADADIITILRKALLVSHKLKLTEFEKWIKNELNGYNSVDNLPEYRRKIKGSLKFRNPYYGLCSIQCETKNFEDLLTRKNITDSIPKLLSLIKDNNSILIMELPPELVQQLWQSNNSALQFEIFLVFDKSIFSNIVEQVKTYLLNWALLLEEQGISGDGVTFSESEEKKANNSQIVNNYQTNIYGDLYGTQLQQGTNKSQQTSK